MLPPYSDCLKLRTQQVSLIICQGAVLFGWTPSAAYHDFLFICFSCSILNPVTRCGGSCKISNMICFADFVPVWMSLIFVIYNLEWQLRLKHAIPRSSEHFLLESEWREYYCNETNYKIKYVFIQCKILFCKIQEHEMEKCQNCRFLSLISYIHNGYIHKLVDVTFLC